MTEERFMELIQEWLRYWMNQKQNSEEDYKNYFRRAFGVDANMRHHLAKLLAEAMRPKSDQCASNSGGNHRFECRDCGAV